MSSAQSKKSPAGLIAGFLIAGVIFLALGILFEVHPDNFLTSYFPWLKTDHPGFIFTVPVLCWILAAVVRYDTQPLPNEYVPPPPRLNLQQNDAWRRPTGFRYLEKRKEEFLELETEIFALHKAAVEAHQKLSTSSGMLEYRLFRRAINHSLSEIDELRVELEQMRDQIVRIASGDVRADVLDIEEQIEKQLRLKQEYESEVREAEVEMPTADKSRRGYLKNRREWRAASIHDVDTELIALRSKLKELREFDFNKLYGELGVSPEAMRTTEAHLQSIRNKAQLVTAIKPPSPQPQPAPPDPAKARAERQAAIQTELQRLEIEKQKMMATISDDDMRRQIENMYNDKRAQVLEDLRKAL